MAPQSNDNNKPFFQKDEKALCFHGEMLYDAKITDVKKTDPKETKSPFHYKVHYKGWKNTWDDWVPQDRLRKPTEENRELAAHLRHQTLLKLNPKMAGKTRRGQGSEIGSGRGSEERTSSVPAAGGRGSKRTRDNETEKVGGSHAHKRTRVNDSRDSRHDDKPRFDMKTWMEKLPLPKEKKAKAYASKVENLPSTNLDIRNPLDAESITSITSLLGDGDEDDEDPSTTLDDNSTTLDDDEDLSSVVDNDDDRTTVVNDNEDMPTTLDDNKDQTSVVDDKEDLPTTLDARGEAEPSQSVEDQQNDDLDLRQFVHVPRKAAVKATTALAKSYSRQPSTNTVTPKKTRAKKNTSKSSNAATKDKAEAANSSTDNAPVGLSKKSLSKSKTVKPRTKDSKVVSAQGKALVSKKPDSTEGEPKAQRASRSNKSLSTAIPDSGKVQNHELLSDTGSEDEVADTTGEDIPENVVTAVRRSVRTTAAVSSAKPKSQIQSESASFPKTKKPLLPRPSPTPSSSSRVPANSKTLRSSTASKTAPPTQLPRAKRAMASQQQLPFRPWKVKDTTSYTSADIDHLLAQPAPQNEPEFVSKSSWQNQKLFNAPLLGGTTSEERNNIDEELRRARKRGKTYQPARLGQEQQLPPHFEEQPSDIESDDEYHGAAPTGSAPGAPFEVDPPGSNMQHDALKYPNRLIERINRDGDRFPLGWTEENLKCIPDHCLVWVREELLVKMPYGVLENRPPWVLKEVPDNAPFWDQWEQENEANIINAFSAKVKGRPTDDHHALRVLATVATDRAFEEAARASRSVGPVTSGDFVVEACKRCVRHGVQCDGVKPVCHPCKQEGRDCDFSFSLVEESYERRGSRSDRQQEFADLNADNLEVALRARVPAPRAITGLDVLALAAEVVESGTANRVEGPPGNTQDPGYGNGSGSPSLTGLFPMLQIALIAESLFPYIVDLEQGIRAYLGMPSQEDAFYTRPSVRITIPDHLKNLLVDDWENVTKSLLLVPLPSQAPANFIIDEYFNEEKMRRRLCSPEAEILEEFCAGLKMYFEKAVGKILLYRFERSQLAEVRKLWESGRHKEWEGKGPGDCYGAEHLTRMIVNLPEMIAQTNMDSEAVARLKTELSNFSVWLSRNSTKYFCAKYEKPSAEYIENAR